VGAVWLLFFVLSCSGPIPTATSNPTPTQVAGAAPADTSGSDSGFDAPDPGSLPEAIAPQSLGEVNLPDQADGIVTLLIGLPSTLMGRQRTNGPGGTGEINASYGTTGPVGCGTVGLQAMNVSTGDFYPQGWTVERVIAVFTTGADWTVEDFGRDGNLFWVVWSTTCSSEGSSGMDSISITSWGNAGSPWVFSASAGNPEGRDELTAAFVTASR